ncbi:MAG: sigma-70 family RNA polymerase sigma factor [Bacteroidota bacterium]
MNKSLQSTSDKSDEQLFELYSNTGEKRWLAVLFDRYRLMVYGVCLKYLKESELASDTTMDIFEKLLNQQSSDEIKKFKVWLYVLTKNQCLMILRKKKPELKELDNDFVESRLIWHPTEEDDDQARQQRLEKCLEALPEGQLECIKGFFYDKQAYQELANSLNLELKKVKSHIQNGKRNLKLCLERNG